MRTRTPPAVVDRQILNFLQRKGQERLAQHPDENQTQFLHNLLNQLGCRAGHSISKRIAANRDLLHRLVVEERYEARLLLVHEKDAVRRARKIGTTAERVSRRAIILRDDRTCYLCARAELMDTEIHLDHVIPLSKGGTHTEDNLRVTCATCNLRKGDGLLDGLLSDASPITQNQHVGVAGATYRAG